MDRHLVISSDCHAGLPPGGYREYLDPQFREAFDVAHSQQIALTEDLEKHFLVKEINEKWREGQESALTGAWVPSYLELLDQRATAHAGSSKLGDFTSHLKLMPSEYFARNIRIGSMAHRSEVERRHDIGVDVLMWGSDYPHPEGSWPETEERMTTAFHAVPEADRDAILGGNAAELYGFDTEKLAPLVSRIGPEKRSFEA